MTATIVRSKLLPLRAQPPLLARPRLATRLARGLEVPLTLVQAGAGYGKSVAVAGFLEQRPELYAWYGLDEDDVDPSIFCSHLVSAADQLSPGLEAALAPLLARRRQGDMPWTLLADAINNHLHEHLLEDVWFVLDDFQHIAAGPHPLPHLLDRFLSHTPPALHVVLISRRWPDLPRLSEARARRQLVQLGERELAFTAAEIHELFWRQHNIAIRPEQIERLGEETEGWAMALQLLAQQLQGLQADEVDLALADLPRRLNALFDFLTDNIIHHQPPHIQFFLYQTAVLRHLTPPACDAVRRSPGSAGILAQLHGAGLSLVQIDEHTYRHHHLVHEFLRRRQRDESAWRRLHRRAAAHFAKTGQAEESIYHLLHAGDFEAAAHAITAVADARLRQGRFNLVAGWLEQLPGAILDDQPDLLIIRGDVARLTSRYETALAAYQRAQGCYAEQGDDLDRSRALESQALVYIDTVRPAPAEALLKQALRALGNRHPSESARLLRLLAENATNRGRLAVAGRWYEAALRLLAEPDLELEARIRLRSGRLEEAAALLQRRARGQNADRPARTHREPILLHAFLQVLMGDAAGARLSGQRGLELARQLHSPFTEAVAHMRLGHAWQLSPLPDRERAAEHYHESIHLMRLLEVARGEAEPQFGLALLHSFAGRPQAAQEAGLRSLELAERAGDGWVVGLARLAMGIDQVRRRDGATALLSQALADLNTCEDEFGALLAHLWLSWSAAQRKKAQEFTEHADAWLAAIESYPFLLFRPTLFGPRDPQQFVPLLLRARDAGIQPRRVQRLLARLNLPLDLPSHPGYSLRLQMLGPFRAWRGETPIEEGEWQRKKARDLLQLLLLQGDRYLHREQIEEHLWPGSEPEAAARQFKVTLNALQKVLEPDRSRSAPPFFVQRRDSTYGLNLAAALVIDCEQFQTQLQEAVALGDEDADHAITMLRQALAMYGDGFLADNLYESWTQPERLRLQELFLRRAETLARLLLPIHAGEAIAWCERILAIDPTWEPAYRVMMRAHARHNQRHLLARAYQRCIDALARELNLPPLPQTTNLYHALVHGIWPEDD